MSARPLDRIANVETNCLDCESDFAPWKTTLTPADQDYF